MPTARPPAPSHDADLLVEGVPIHAHSWRHGPHRFVFTMEPAPDGRYHVATMDDAGVVGVPVDCETLGRAEREALHRYWSFRHPGEPIVWAIPHEHRDN